MIDFADAVVKFVSERTPGKGQNSRNFWLLNTDIPKQNKQLSNYIHITKSHLLPKHFKKLKLSLKYLSGGLLQSGLSVF